MYKRQVYTSPLYLHGKCCESVYEQVPYDTVEACQKASEQVSITAQEMFPMSTGQVWCLTEEEFNKYQDYYDVTDET